MKKLIFIYIALFVSTSTIFATTFSIKTPSSNTVLKFDGQIISNTNTVNITSPYLPSLTLTKDELLDLQKSLNLLIPNSTSVVQITLTLDSSAIQILKNATTPPFKPTTLPLKTVTPSKKK